MFIIHRARVTELAAQHKLPAVYPLLLPVTDTNGHVETAKALGLTIPPSLLRRADQVIE